MLREVKGWLAQAEALRHEKRRPLVSLCYAQSLDGSITAQPGQPTALSGAESSRLTHWLRASHDAILVGVGTVLADDPLLTVRLVQGKHPQPVILDSQLRTPPQAKLLREHPLHAWIATTQNGESEKGIALREAGARLLQLPPDNSGQVHLPSLLEHLAGLGINSLMVEGGAQVIRNFLGEGLADQLILTIAPLFTGGLPIIEEGITLPRPLKLAALGYKRMGDDLVVWGKIQRL